MHAEDLRTELDALSGAQRLTGPGYRLFGIASSTTLSATLRSE